MAILSKRLIGQVSAEYSRRFGLKARLVNVAGRVESLDIANPIVRQPKRKTSYALHESINLGVPYVYTINGSIAVWVVGLEDCNIVHGGLISGEVRLQSPSSYSRSVLAVDNIIKQFVDAGMSGEDAGRYVDGLPIWNDEQVRVAAEALQDIFYMMSGWKPVLIRENRLKHLQKEQFSRAIEDQRKTGVQVLYNFEKERLLLTNIKAGDKNEARRMLNEMLAMIYMSSQQMAVLRARTIELLSYLSRAAIEDNPMLEPLIEKNHSWIHKLVKAKSFEELSEVLRCALDEFINGIYLHGVNRSSKKIRAALDYINISYGQKVSLSTTAAKVGLSPWRFAHLVKSHTGKTFSQTLQQIRIQNAQRLLDRTSKTCTDVAYACGYQDQSYFIKHFRRITGTTPAKYRKCGG